MTNSKLARFKFFSGPYVGTIQEGHIVKRTLSEGWRLQTEDGDLLDLDAGIRMGPGWEDVELVSSSQKEAVFRPIYRFKLRGKKFAVRMENLT